MSRKLRAMRDARERRRLEGGEPRYPRDLPAHRGQLPPRTRSLIFDTHFFPDASRQRIELQVFLRAGFCGRTA